MKKFHITTLLLSIVFFTSCSGTSRTYVDNYVFQPAHLPQDFICADKETDLGVALAPKQENEVSFVGDSIIVGDNYLTGKIVEETDLTLTITVNDSSKIYAGLSGTCVYSEDNTEIGYISAYLGKNRLKCVKLKRKVVD